MRLPCCSGRGAQTRVRGSFGVQELFSCDIKWRNINLRGKNSPFVHEKQKRTQIIISYKRNLFEDFRFRYAFEFSILKCFVADFPAAYQLLLFFLFFINCWFVLLVHNYHEGLWFLHLNYDFYIHCESSEKSPEYHDRIFLCLHNCFELINMQNRNLWEVHSIWPFWISYLCKAQGQNMYVHFTTPRPLYFLFIYVFWWDHIP